MRSEQQAAVTTTFVLIGSTTVGKSAIATALLHQPFATDSISTIGGASLTVTYEDQGITKKILIWDTAGQEQYRALGPMYYRGSAGAVCVYDVTNRPSFADAPGWISAYRGAVGDGPGILLIGNKVDLEGRAVSTEEGREFATREKYRFLETSAKTGANMELIVPELKALGGDSGKAGAPPQRASSGCC
jgi:small GTP-binding protein